MTLGAARGGIARVMWVVARWAFSMNTPEILVLAGFLADAIMAHGPASPWAPPPRPASRPCSAHPAFSHSGAAARPSSRSFGAYRLSQRRCCWSCWCSAGARAAAFETSLPLFAAVALALAALFVFATRPSQSNTCPAIEVKADSAIGGRGPRWRSALLSSRRAGSPSPSRHGCAWHRLGPHPAAGSPRWRSARSSPGSSYSRRCSRTCSVATSAGHHRQPAALRLWRPRRPSQPPE